jgi:integrase/recombinase XerD
MKKSEPTIVEKAIQTVDGFEKVFNTIKQQTILRGQSKSTLNNYIRRIALISLHFNKLPEHISEDDINEYLTSLAQSAKSPSRSSFKHAVYGLRYYFRHLGLNKRAIDLPSIKDDSKLPVILNRNELRQLFIAPTLLKHRIVLTLIYSAGLRSQEVVNLKLADIDFERKTIHIRQSKYKKDRIVPLSNYMAKGLKQYIAVEHPHIWLFNGKEPDGRYSVKGLSWVMRESLKKTSITKEVSLHSLRHSYATHLLEDGVNIITIKELLGHAEIATTMVYLHVAQCPVTPAHSPLDSLYADVKCNVKKTK